jgi:hypothetical protein
MASSPRAVRNFWVTGEIDGRRNPISGGPRARDGGISLTLYQRSEGSIETSLKVSCSASPDGTLRVEVAPVLPFRLTRRDGTLKIVTKR